MKIKLKSDRFWKELTDYVLRQVETWIEDRGSEYFFMEYTKLKPCPFCGASKAELIGGETFNWIVCRYCDAESGSYETEEVAVKVWNDLTGRIGQEDE